MSTCPSRIDLAICGFLRPRTEALPLPVAGQQKTSHSSLVPVCSLSSSYNGVDEIFTCPLRTKTWDRRSHIHTDQSTGPVQNRAALVHRRLTKVVAADGRSPSAWLEKRHVYTVFEEHLKASHTRDTIIRMTCSSDIANQWKIAQVAVIRPLWISPIRTWCVEKIHKRPCGSRAYACQLRRRALLMGCPKPRVRLY